MTELLLQWKTSESIPLPKRPNPVFLNDYRHIALTSLLMKSFERIVLKYMLPEVKHLLDPLQFAYRTKCSVEDATLSMLNVIREHLECPGPYARILLVDFSSAFNTIQLHLMVRKFIDLGVGKKLLAHSFRTNHAQYIKVNGLCLPCVSISSGAPQVCAVTIFVCHVHQFL